MQREKQPKRPSASADDESATDASSLADKFEWVGEPLKSSAHRDFYKAVRLLDTGDVVKMRDNVMVEAGVDNEPYVAKCLAMWEDKRTHVRWMRTQWYFRAGDVPDEALSSVKHYSHIVGKGGLRKREVFESQSHDDNDLRAMISTATVTHDPVEFARLQKNVGGTTTFLCRFSYDPREQMLRPLDILTSGSDQTPASEERRLSSGSKPASKSATTEAASTSSTTPDAAPKASKGSSSASKPKASSAANEDKSAKQSKSKTSVKVKPPTAKRPRNSTTPKTSSANNASFVYSRDTGDSDVFAQDPDTPEMIEEGKPSLGTDNGASEGAKDGNLSVDVSEGEQVESESEGDNQGLLSPTGKGTSHARIGPDFQADVPSWEESQQALARATREGLDTADGSTDDGQQTSTCVWQSSRFTYEVIETFLSSARQLMQLAVGQRVQVVDSSGRSTWCLILGLSEGNSPLRKVHVFDGFSDWHVFACECRLPFPEDLALRCLMHADGDMGRALRTFNRVLKDRIFLTQNPQCPQWKRREVQASCDVVQTYRDDLVAVSRALRQRGVDKTYQDVLQLYYSLYLPRRSKRIAGLWLEGNHDSSSSNAEVKGAEAGAAEEGSGKKRARDSEGASGNGVFSSFADFDDDHGLSPQELAAKKRHVAGMGVWSVKVDPDEPLTASATEFLQKAKPLLPEPELGRLKSYLRQQCNPRSDLPPLIKKTISMLTPFPTLLSSYASLISELKSSRS